MIIVCLYDFMKRCIHLNRNFIDCGFRFGRARISLMFCNMQLLKIIRINKELNLLPYINTVDPHYGNTNCIASQSVFSLNTYPSVIEDHSVFPELQTF